MEQKVNFQSYDGTELVGILNTAGNTTKGALLMIHGMPSEKNEWGFYSDMSAFLAEHGIVSFRFDLRYNGESQEGSISNLTLSNMCNDIESAYWQLKNKLPNAIPIYAVGTSFSGGVTVKWANIFKRDIAHIFLMAPLLDYDRDITGNKLPPAGNNYIAMPEKSLKLLKENGVLDDEVRYGYHMINEAHLFDINHELSLNKSPITVFQGDSDSSVPLGITKEYTDQHGYIELVIIKGADHGFAVEGDDDLTFPGTKENHFFVYQEQLNRMSK